MSWNTLRPQFATLLETLKEQGEVHSSPKLKFDKFPAFTVTPSDSEGDYETTSENLRVYAFKVRVFYDTKKTGVSTAMDRLEGFVDSIIDKLDQEDKASSRTIGNDMPANYTYIALRASPSFWGEVQGEDLIFGEITAKVIISVDIT